jgi:hypothetical protein
VITINISPAIVNMLVFAEITKLHGRDLLFNPFFKAHPGSISFVTYTMVANVPNGINNFKFRLTNPLSELIHETSINAVEVKDNAFYNILIWNNLPLTMAGEHTITFYLATEKGFEPIGSTIIIVTNPPKEG